MIDQGQAQAGRDGIKNKVEGLILNRNWISSSCESINISSWEGEGALRSTWIHGRDTKGQTTAVSSFYLLSDLDWRYMRPGRQNWWLHLRVLNHGRNPKLAAVSLWKHSLLLNSCLHNRVLLNKYFKCCGLKKPNKQKSPWVKDWSFTYSF